MTESNSKEVPQGREAPAAEPPARPRRLEVSARLRTLMRYPKFAKTPRLLLLQSHYWLDSACRRAALQLGWEVEMAPVLMEGAMPRDMIAGLLERITVFQPDFVLTVNLGGMDMLGLFAGLFEDLELPYVTWFVDDPRTIIMDRDWYASPFAVALTWEEAYSGYLRGVGFPEVHVLPLAADTAVFNGATPSESPAIPCSFVGSSMAGYARREWAWLHERPLLQRALEDAFDQERVTRERFGTGMDTILGARFWGTRTAEERRHLELVCFIEGTRRLRVDLVQALNAQRLVVRGDDGWNGLATRCGPPVDYEQDLPGWYRDTAVNLNTTSLQMASAVNQRVFDCPAAGGFLLTDAQSSLEELFEPEELATYPTWEACQELTHYYGRRPAARKAMVEAAQRRILAHHTYGHRLQTLLSVLKSRLT